MIVYLHIEDMGDGSIRPKLYNTLKEAQAAAEQEFEQFGQALDENVSKVTMQFDEHGNLLDYQVKTMY